MTPTTVTETLAFDRVAAVLPQVRASLRRQDVAATAQLMAADSGLLLLATHALERADAAELAIPPAWACQRQGTGLTARLGPRLVRGDRHHRQDAP